MAADLSEAAQEFRDLATVLRQVGADDLKRELYKAINDAAQPVADIIGNTSHLKEYMPNRYAAVLADDLQVTTHARAGGTSPGITIFARAPTEATGGRGGRKIRQREAGIITHPLFGDRERWYVQEAGMRAGFFDTPAERSAPQVREAILAAMRRIADKATGKG